MMPRFSANIGLLFTEIPFVERFAAGRKAGFEAMEFPYTEDISATFLAYLLRETDLEQSLVKMPYDPTELGLASSPGRDVDFRERLIRALQYAEATGCKMIHVLAGKAQRDVTPAQSDAALVRNLMTAATLTEPRGMTIAVEAINR